MKKQLIVVGIIILLIAVGLSGCTDNASKLDERFVGTWITEQIGISGHIISHSEKLIFYNSGEFAYYIDNSTFMDNITDYGYYDIREGILYLSYYEGGIYDSFVFDFTNNNTTLMLTYSDNTSQIYTKQ